MAACYGRLDCVSALLRWGADVTTKNVSKTFNFERKVEEVLMNKLGEGERERGKRRERRREGEELMHNWLGLYIAG